MIVVADTSPICYLLLINLIELLPHLYGQVFIPQAVQQELADERSPGVIRDWIAQPPEWLVVLSVDVVYDSQLDSIDPGEREAIVLAEQQGADLVVIDDGLGRQVAQSRHLKITGLLGVLDEAARQKLIDFADVIARLEKTTFRASKNLIRSLLLFSPLLRLPKLSTTL